MSWIEINVFFFKDALKWIFFIHTVRLSIIEVWSGLVSVSESETLVRHNFLRYGIGIGHPMSYIGDIILLSMSFISSSSFPVPSFLFPLSSFFSHISPFFSSSFHIPPKMTSADIPPGGGGGIFFTLYRRLAHQLSDFFHQIKAGRR